MITGNSRRNLLSLLIIFSLGLLLKLPGVIFRPTDYLYDPVELAQIFSIYGLFAGLTPAAITFWSMGVYAIPLVIAYSIDAVFLHPQIISALFRHDPGVFIREFSVYIGGVFLNSDRQLVIGRLFVAIITSFSFLPLYKLFYKKGRVITAISSTAIFLTSPYLIRQSYGFMPDAIGLAFFCFALAFTLEDKLNTSSVVISGIFLGLAIASKFIYMAFLPIAVLAVLFAGEKNKNKSYAGLISNLLVFAAGVIITVFIFIPFIWTSPLALAKNIFGTLSMYYVKHNFCWNSLLLEKLPLYINWFGLVLCLIGLVTSFYILNKKTAIFLVSGLVMFLLSLGKADFLLPRYVLPLIPYLCIYSGMGIELIVRPFKNKLKFLLVVLILGAILTSHLIGIAKDFKFTHGRTNASDCRNWVNNNIKADSGIAVPEYLSHLFVPNEVTLKKWLGALGNSYNNIDERLDGLCLMTKMKYGDLKRDNPLVPRVFGALEQQRMFVYESLLWYYRNVSRPKNAYNLFLYTPVNLYEFGMIALKDEDAVRLLLGGEVVALVSDLRLSLPSYIAIMNFDQTLGIPYYLYLNKEAKP